MTKILKYIYVVVAIALFSCEPEVVDMAKTPEFDQKIVTYCYLNPEDSINYAIVKYNMPVFGEIVSETFINPNNKVVISDGTNETEFAMKHDTFLLDNHSFPIAEGKEYTLTVTDYKGNKVNAKCTIPFQRKIDLNWDTTSYIKHQEYGDEIFLKVTTSFTDYTNESNFYRIIGKTISYYDTVNNNYASIWQISDEIRNDYLTDGKMMKCVMDVPAYVINSNVLVFLNISILQTDRNYYEFYKSLNNYSFDDNPFTEVTHLYSNINGGLGIFSAYNKQEVIIKLK